MQIPQETNPPKEKQHPRFPETGINSSVKTEGGVNSVDPKEAFKNSFNTRKLLKALWDAA